MCVCSSLVLAAPSTPPLCLSRPLRDVLVSPTQQRCWLICSLCGNSRLYLFRPLQDVLVSPTQKRCWLVCSLCGNPDVRFFSEKKCHLGLLAAPSAPPFCLSRRLQFGLCYPTNRRFAVCVATLGCVFSVPYKMFWSLQPDKGVG